MDHVTLLLIQRSKPGEDAEFKDEKETEGSVFVTDDRLVVYAQANSPEELPERLKTDSELGPNLEFFTKLGDPRATPEEDLTSALEINDILLKGTYNRGSSIKRVVVKADNKYVVKGLRRLTREEYESGAAILRHGPRARLGSMFQAPRRQIKRAEVIESEPISEEPKGEGTYQKPAEKSGFLEKLVGLYKRAIKPVAIGTFAVAAVTAGLIGLKTYKYIEERENLKPLSIDAQSELRSDLKSKIAPLLPRGKNYSYKDGNCEYKVSVDKNGVKIKIRDTTNNFPTIYFIAPNGQIRGAIDRPDMMSRSAYARVGEVLDKVLEAKGE